MIPSEVVYEREHRRLWLRLESGPAWCFPVDYLRAWCPCAQCQGHGVGTRFRDDFGNGLEIVSMQSVGAYALGITFSDGHNTGIFRWSWLQKISPTLWGRRCGRFMGEQYVPSEHDGPMVLEGEGPPS